MYPVVLFTERPKWRHTPAFVFYTAGLVFSPFSVWKFPIVWTEYGGAACLVPWVVCLLMVGLPLVCLELILGQFMQRCGPRMWAAVPLCKGLGTASLLVAVLKVATNLILGAWSMCYLYLVLTNQLPRCDTNRTAPDMFTTDSTRGNGSESEAPELRATELLDYGDLNPQAPINLTYPMFGLVHQRTDNQTVTCHQWFLEYWRREVTEVSPGLWTPGSAALKVFVTALLVSSLCFLIVVRDIRWSGKMMYILAALLLAGCVSIVALTASSGNSPWRDVYSFLSPDFGKLADPQTWFGSVRMTLLTLNLGTNVIPFLGSYSSLDNHVIRNSWLVCLLAMFANLLVGLSMSGLLNNVTWSREPLTDPGWLFASVFSEMRTYDHRTALSCLICLVVLTVVVSTSVVYTESVVSSLVDLSVKLRRCRLLVVTATVSTCFLLTIAMSTQGGVFVFLLLERVTDGGFIITIIMLLQCLAVVAVYGANRFYDTLEAMTGRRPGRWLRCCWVCLTPVILLATLIYQEYSEPFFRLGSEDSLVNFDLANWALLLLVVGILLQLPVVGVCVLCGRRGSCRQKLRSAMKPKLKPHQVPIKWRLEGHWTKFGNVL